MKNYLHFRINRLYFKVLFLGVISFIFMGIATVRAQVNFTQTLTADFNKGVVNNAIVASDNISLPFGASDVSTWLTTTVLPQTLAGHKTVSWNDRYVYMVGGYNNTNYVNTVYVATIQAGGITGWTAQNPLPVALRDPAVVIGTNTIYVMGGRDGSQVYNTIYYATINTDGTIGAWQTSAVTLPANLWGHTATYLMGYIYVIGGTSSMTENTALNTVYYTKVNALNTLSSFTTGLALSAAVNRHSTVTYNNKLYVIGGYNNIGTRSSSVYYATPAINGAIASWTLAAATLPVALSNHSAAVSNGLITVMAGATGATLSNTVYYTNPDVLTWTTSSNVMYDYTKDGSAFTGNGQVYYTGGANLSGTPIVNCRYANMVLTANYSAHGVFVSNPFYELGAERLITTLTFNKTYTPPANIQVNYRTAGSDGIWGDWTALVTTSPITVNQSKQYLQYAVALTGSTVNNATFLDMTLTTPGTQLNGNLNATTTFTKALSPYWATSDISFTSGTHTFEAGATILFLPETGLSVGAAHVECLGTIVDSVKFLYYTSETGKWDGIYFDDNSDVGVNSSFNYVVIANAGFGAPNANLYCLSTSEPLLNHCSLRNAEGHGIRMNNAFLTIQNSVIKSNSENGVYLENSNPSFTGTSLSYNSGAGVFLTSTTSNPTYSTTTIDHNQSGFRYPSPNFNFFQPNGTPTLTANTYNGLAMDGGDVTASNKRWNTITYDYILLGTVNVVQYGGNVRLTIEPGNVIRTTNLNQIRIGGGYPYGGELYAIAPSDSMITFTSHNGLAGGWSGIYFMDYSDSYAGQSQLDYCIIEKGLDYNYFSEYTVQPNLLNHCKIQNAVLDGARYSNAFGAITNTQFLNNGRYPLYYMNPEADPVHTGNIYTGNVINRIALSGGTYSFNRTITNDGIPYYVLDNMSIALYGSTSRLTINPGISLEFAVGKKLIVGGPYPYGGELFAQGTLANPILFSPYNGLAGGWEGIHFMDFNDYYGGNSIMEYCKVRKGNAQNLLVENSTKPTMNNCEIRESAGNGIVLYQSNPSITNSLFTLNAGYPLKFNDWTCDPYLRGNSYLTNGLNYIALSGGDYTSNRTLLFDNVTYHVLGNINVLKYGALSRLTINPGITMLFNPGIQLQIGAGWPYSGELIAEGKSDSTIFFKPYNNLAGGWAGIYFADYSSDYGAASSLKYCWIEKGATYNMYSANTNQPTLDHCTLTLSTGNGFNISNSTPTIKSSTFTYNAGYGINIDGSSPIVIGNTSSYTCNILNNYGAYDLYNNSANTIDARYNFWGSGDSTMLNLRIYDKSDNTAKGRVYTGPFAQVPSQYTTATVMSGTVKYANVGANPIKTATMVVKDFGGATINTTTTNTSGVYAFSSMVSGNYKMTITPSAVWGGVNSTDALNILNHFAMITPLTGMKLAAADVNFSHSANGTDALLVMKRYSGMITSFAAGDYLYHYDTVITNGSNVTGNIEMICFGDVNASYAPAKKSSSSIGLVHEGSLLVESLSEFDFPVKLKSAMQVGAISLGFYYPEQYLEITGARLADGTTGFSWTAIDGLFRMAWCNMNAINVNNDEVVVILSMKAKDLSGLASGIALDIYEESEFADAMATPNDLEVVSIPTINTTLTGVNPGNGLTGLTVYPNPLSQNSVIEFSLQQPGTMRISLLDVVGNHIMVIAADEFTTGNHKVGLESTGLRPGIYLLKIENTSGGQTISGMIKVVSY